MRKSLVTVSDDEMDYFSLSLSLSYDSEMGDVFADKVAEIN
jgi:hypothetical protein